MLRRAEPKSILSSFNLGDMTLFYVRGDETGSVGMRLIPTGMEEMVCDKKCGIEPLVQARLLCDSFNGAFSNGRTLRTGGSVTAMEYDRQEVCENDGCLRIDTYIKDARGYVYIHSLSHPAGAQYITTKTTFINNSNDTATLEMLSSFALGELSFFGPDFAADALELYRIKSNWCGEGRLIHEAIENADLETYGYGTRTTRWGQVGSMPTRDYAPIAAVEDKNFGVIWAAQISAAASWQMEAGGEDLGFVLSGGIADREFGHWLKNIEPGCSFTTPDAILTVSTDGIDDACQRLIDYTEDRIDVPESEESLPLLFNEWPTSSGKPSEDLLCSIADAIERLKLGYFVIDAGWYAEKDGPWYSLIGSWNVSPHLYTRGLETTLDYIRSKGLQPGIWFEFESVGYDCVKFNQTDLLLTRDGVPLTVGDRRFWDFRKPEVQEYLHEKVIEFLRRYNFKYIKVDYNDSEGIGVDGAESLGEGLRTQIEAVRDFFRRIHKELPDVVIEACSAGGLRLTPAYLELASLASFSDAHGAQVPIIAANLHRMIPARQNQIWAVLHNDYSEAMLYNKLTGGLLGRLCISGQVLDMSPEQWSVIEKCVDFYKKAAPIIKKGRSRRYGPDIASWKYPKGWQAVVRVGNNAALAVVHTFKNANATYTFPIPAGYKVTDICARDGIKAVAVNSHLVVTGLADYDGVGILLEKA